MATLAQIRKYASSHFTQEMKKQDFELARRGLFYWRKINDIHQIVVLGFNRGNEQMFVSIFAWVPELAPQPYDWDRFPDGVTKVTGGELSDSKVVQGASFSQWPVLTESECLSGLAAALNLIDRVALPWFSGITNRIEMVQHVRKDSQTDRFGNKTADKIMGKKLLLRAEMPPPIGAKRGI